MKIIREIAIIIFAFFLLVLLFRGCFCNDSLSEKNRLLNSKLIINVKGLRGRLVLENESGAELVINSNGQYWFNKEYLSDDLYKINVKEFPFQQKYVFKNAQGTIKEKGVFVKIKFKPILKKEQVLKNKYIGLSAGHGYIYDRKKGKWRFQRGVMNALLEDTLTQVMAIEYIIPMFERSGARIINLRERVYGGANVIVNEDSSYCSFKGEWVIEKGGYKKFHKKYITGSGKASVSWDFSTPVDGKHSLYIYITPSEENASSVQYIVSHAGGESSVFIDQSRKLYFPTYIKNKRSGVWIPAGEFYFYGGKAYQVKLVTHNIEAGKKVVADAIRLGGGAGFANFGGGKSGALRWEQGALPFLKELGVPGWILKGDVKCRSLYALYNMVDVFLSIHTNAGNHVSGTSTYVYYPAPPSYPKPDKNILPPATLELAQLIHNRIVEAAVNSWSNDWRDLGVYGAWFGELRAIRDAWARDNSIAIPAVLTEVAFHDNRLDAGYLENDRFRRDISRAILKGSIDFFTGQEGGVAIYPPLAPRNIFVNNKNGKIFLSWLQEEDEVDPFSASADYFLIYFSYDGKAFNNNPHASKKNKIEIISGNIKPAYFKVTAVNKAGESMDSKIVSIK